MTVTIPTIPTNPTEFEEALSDSAKIAALFRAGQFPEFVKAYAAATHKADPDLGAQIKAEVQMGLAEFAKANGVTGRPDVRPAGTGKDAGARYNPKAVGAQLDGEFEDMQDFLTAVLPENKRTRADRDRWDQIENDYSTIDPSRGGFLVPEKVRSELLMNSLEDAIIRPGATVVPMDAPRVPFPCVDETTHNGSIYGGVTWTWVAEGAALPESEGRFGRVVLDVAKLVSYCEAPSELPLDAPAAFGAFINQAMPAALAFGMDTAHLTGTGVGQPLGILNAANLALIAVAKETNQLATTLVKENIDKAFSRMLPTSIGKAIWVATIDTFPQLASLSGQDNSPVWLNNGVVGAPPITIYGRPVEFTEKTPTLGQQGDLSFIDRRQYLVGDLGQMRVDSSIHYKFGNDLVVYRVIDRSDGRPWMRSAVTPANGSTSTLSPYVTIAARL